MSERKTGLLTRARTGRADIAYDSHVNKMTARAKATLPLVTASLFPPLEPEHAAHLLTPHFTPDERQRVAAAMERYGSPIWRHDIILH